MRASGILAVALIVLVAGGCAGASSPSPSGDSALKRMPNQIDQSGQVLNVYEWGNARQILLAARALIERDGWQQGATEPTDSWCASTALEGAWLQGPYSIVDFNYARAALSDTIGVPREPAISKEAGAPDVPYWGAYFVDWNDDPARTEGEVLKAFDDAAALAATLSTKAAASP